MRPGTNHVQYRHANFLERSCCRSQATALATIQSHLLEMQRATPAWTNVSISSTLEKSSRKSGSAASLENADYESNQFNGASHTIESQVKTLNLSGSTASSLYRHFSRASSPVSAFETSASFQPVSYTVVEDQPELFTLWSAQTSVTHHVRTNNYAMFFRNSSRRWLRLTLSLTISFESNLWNLARLSDRGIRGTDPPTVVRTMIANLMATEGRDVPDTHLELFVGGNFLTTGSNGDQLNQFCIEKPQLMTEAALRITTNMLYHAGCRCISEQDVTTIPLPNRRRNFWFISSNRESQWLLDFRFGSDQDTNEILLYRLNVLHSLQGKPGICPFVGVVLDQDTKVAKGFLAEAPAMGFLFREILSKIGNDEHIPWKRRERWCKNIVQALTEVHSKGYVVGELGDIHHSGICLDSNDCAVLYSFRPSLGIDTDCGQTVIPPEFGGANKIGSIISRTATPQSDIFLLGLTIWIIAGCKEPVSLDRSLHLPILGGDVPAYLNNVIAACRKPNPFDRPAAWKILESFPPETGQDRATNRPTSSGVAGSSVSQHGALQQARRLYDSFVTCNTRSCRRLCCDHLFNCTVCDEGGYDLCPHCFEDGRHCRDDSHLLKEQRVGVPGMKYSSVRENGRRESFHW